MAHGDSGKFCLLACDLWSFSLEENQLLVLKNNPQTILIINFIAWTEYKKVGSFQKNKPSKFLMPGCVKTFASAYPIALSSGVLQTLPWVGCGVINTCCL